MLKPKMPKRTDKFSCNSLPAEGNMVVLCATRQPKTVSSGFLCLLVREEHNIQPQWKRGARAANRGEEGIRGYTKQKTGDRKQGSPEPHAEEKVPSQRNTEKMKLNSWIIYIPLLSTKLWSHFVWLVHLVASVCHCSKFLQWAHAADTSTINQNIWRLLTNRIFRKTGRMYCGMLPAVASFPWEWLRELHHLLCLSIPLLREEPQKTRWPTLNNTDRHKQWWNYFAWLWIINIWEVLSVGKNHVRRYEEIKSFAFQSDGQKTLRKGCGHNEQCCVSGGQGGSEEEEIQVMSNSRAKF